MTGIKHHGKVRGAVVIAWQLRQDPWGLVTVFFILLLKTSCQRVVNQLIWRLSQLRQRLAAIVSVDCSIAADGLSQDQYGQLLLTEFLKVGQN